MEVALTGSTVYLNVYDLYVKINFRNFFKMIHTSLFFKKKFFEKNYGAPVGLGLYHTGVEVNGKGKAIKNFRIPNKIKIYPLLSRIWFLLSSIW